MLLRDFMVIDETSTYFYEIEGIPMSVDIRARIRNLTRLGYLRLGIPPESEF